MASLKYEIHSKKDYANLYVRLSYGRGFDFRFKTNLSIQVSKWSNEKQLILDNTNSQIIELNKKLSDLKFYLINAFNLDYSSGVYVDKSWLEEKTNLFLNRPIADKKDNSSRIYYTDFATWWMINKSPKHKVSANNFMGERTINQYENLILIVKKFEGKNKIKFTSINSDFLDSFSNYLFASKYSKSTSKRMITRFKFFLSRAEEEGIKIHSSYKKKTFVIENENEDFKRPHFSYDEINILYKKDLSFNKTLEDVRDNLIIGLWTGLRVSDFLKRLDVSNIDGDFIKIKTKKTKTWVLIPIHNQVKEILKKRMGFFPPKISDQRFNDYIKIIAQICDFDKEMTGTISKVDPVTKEKRNVIGVYKKYELVTSHICRRSFATNLRGEVSDQVICDLGGWKTVDMMLNYIQETEMESALIVKKLWENKNQ